MMKSIVEENLAIFKELKNKIFAYVSETVVEMMAKLPYRKENRE